MLLRCWQEVLNQPEEGPMDTEILKFIAVEGMTAPADLQLKPVVPAK